MIETLDNIRRLVNWWSGLSAHAKKNGYVVEFTPREKELIAFVERRGGLSALCRPFDSSAARAQRVFSVPVLLQDGAIARRIVRESTTRHDRRS